MNTGFAKNIIIAGFTGGGNFFHDVYYNLCSLKMINCYYSCYDVTSSNTPWWLALA